MNNITRLIISCLSALGFAFILAACNRNEPVKLGFVGGLTGRGADLGVAGRNGAMLAIEQRNLANGINGRRLELLVRDDEQNPETAQRVVAELIKQKVGAIIGPMTSSMAMAIVPSVNAAKTVMISPTVTTSDLTGRDDYFFRVISDTQGYASKSARHQLEKCGHRSAVAIYDDNNRAYTENWFNYFRTTFEGLGGKMLQVKTFKSGSETGFSETVKELLAVKPDMILIIANSVDAALICQQVRKLDPRVSFALAEWAATERLIELGGAALDGAHVDQYFNRDDTSAKITAFISAYRGRFGIEPGFAGVAAYDATNVALDALTGKSWRQTLRQYILAEPTFQGLQQAIVFDRFGDSQRKTYVSIISDGKFKVIE